MSKAKSKTDVQSERLLEINWQEPGIDSTRNPVVEASQQACAEAEAKALDVVEAAIEAVFDQQPELVADPVSEPAAVAETTCATASIRIDEVFNHIAPFRALHDNGVSPSSLLGRQLMAQANALFNTAFINIQARYGYADIYVDAPVREEELPAEREDITSIAVHEVLRLQRLI